MSNKSGADRVLASIKRHEKQEERKRQARRMSPLRKDEKVSNRIEVYYAPDELGYGRCPQCGYPIGEYREYEDNRIVVMGSWCWCDRDRIESTGAGGPGRRSLQLLVGVGGEEDHPIGRGERKYREPTVAEVQAWLRERHGQ